MLQAPTHLILQYLIILKKLDEEHKQRGLLGLQSQEQNQGTEGSVSHIYCDPCLWNVTKFIFKYHSRIWI